MAVRRRDRRRFHMMARNARVALAKSISRCVTNRLGLSRVLSSKLEQLIGELNGREDETTVLAEDEHGAAVVETEVRTRRGREVHLTLRRDADAAEPACRYASL